MAALLSRGTIWLLFEVGEETLRPPSSPPPPLPGHGGATARNGSLVGGEHEIGLAGLNLDVKAVEVVREASSARREGGRREGGRNGGAIGGVRLRATDAGASGCGEGCGAEVEGGRSPNLVVFNR